MHKLVTAEGWEFNAQSFVHIGDKLYDMDELSAEQLDYVGAMLNVQGLNAAYAGELKFQAEGLPPFKTLFPD
ncbi:MAG: hypothetical protein RSB55_09715 [Oscillospiraceae bacterium]